MHHRFADVFYRHAHAVEAVLEAEPGVEAEDALVLLDRGDDRTSLGDSPRHGLLAPNVLTRFGRSDGDDGMPVGRGRHMDDVDVLAGQNLAEVLVALAVGAAGLHCLGEVVGVYVADSQQFAGGVDGVDMSHAHAAGTDDGAG